MNGAILLVVPVLNRPGRVAPFLASLEASGADVPVLFMGTTKDSSELAALDDAGAWHIDIDWAPGDFARKVNHAFTVTDHDAIMVTGDDVHFHPGWLDAALACQAATGAGVVGTNDLHNLRVLAGEHATHWLITRDYARQGTIDEPGKVLHEGYCHWFVDDELIATARKRGRWAFAADSKVEHLHPNYGGAPPDSTYSLARRRAGQDRALFSQREHLWT